MTARFALRSREEWHDPFTSYRTLRDSDPVHLVDYLDHEPFHVLTRFDDVFTAVRDTATFSSASGLTPDADGMDMFEDNAAPIVMMDPPVHTQMRRTVSRPMTPRQVAAIEPAVTAFVDRCLDAVDTAWSAAAGPVDIVEHLFKPLPSFVVAHFLGVPDDERGRFDEWTNAIVAANAEGEIANAAEAALGLFAFAQELIERRRTEPGDDLVSGLVASTIDGPDGTRAEVSAEWIVGFVFTMVTGGNDTTTGLLGGAAELLARHPEQRQLLLDDPSLVRPAIDEFLRLTSPVQNLARTTTRPVTVAGTEIPEGRKVLLVYGSANRDEREFGPTADALDVTRTVDRHLALGYGAHHCLGAAAARLQSAIAIERLLDRWPGYTVDTDAARWAPGSYVRRYESLPFVPAAR